MALCGSRRPAHDASRMTQDGPTGKDDLLFGLSLRAPQLIGLDIGTTAVKAARVRRKGGRLTVTGLARTVIEQSERGGPPTGENISLAVWRTLHTLREADTDVVCGLAGPEVAVRTFEFPPLPLKQLASAVELEADQVCPFELDESTVTHEVLRGLPARRAARILKKEAPVAEKVTGIFAAARNDVIQKIRELCERGRTHCAMIDIDGLALLNCLEVCKVREEGQTAMVLNVGSSYTNVAIVSRDGLPFVRDIAYAGEHIIRHVCQATGVERPTIVGALGRTDESRFAMKGFQEGLEEACATLVDRVMETVRYYGTQPSAAAVDRVFLCGGMTRAKAITDILLQLPAGEVKLWDPLPMLPCVRAVQKHEVSAYGLAFVVALGLAMRSVRDVHH